MGRNRLGKIPTVSPDPPDDDNRPDDTIYIQTIS